jgi:hypothetical protein
MLSTGTLLATDLKHGGNLSKEWSLEASSKDSALLFSGVFCSNLSDGTRGTSLLNCV